MKVPIPVSQAAIPAAMMVTRPTARNVSSVPISVSLQSCAQRTHTTSMLQNAASTSTVTLYRASSQSSD